MNPKTELIKQFRQPHGALGRVAGHIMATRTSNVERNRRTIELLELQPGHNVLEIGHGPGVALAEIARLVSDGHVTGIDHSPLMQSVAAERLAKAGLSDRSTLHVMDATDLGDFLPGPFHRIVAVNVWQFWTEPISVLAALRTRLAPAGRLIITHQPRHSGADAGDTAIASDELTSQLDATGYVEIEAKAVPLDGVPAIAVLGHSPSSSGRADTTTVNDSGVVDTRPSPTAG